MPNSASVSRQTSLSRSSLLSARATTARTTPTDSKGWPEVCDNCMRCLTVLKACCFSKSWRWSLASALSVLVKTAHNSKCGNRAKADLIKNRSKWFAANSFTSWAYSAIARIKRWVVALTSLWQSSPKSGIALSHHQISFNIPGTMRQTHYWIISRIAR